MIYAPRLLRDLQGELAPLVADLGAKVKDDEAVRERLDREWRTAFDAHRTGRSFEEWLEDRLTQVGVAWLLACVFVRFCEDNLLIDEATIAGPGDRGDAARAAQQRYFTEHPHDSDREYLQWVFRAAATLPSLGGLVAEGESPLWQVDPPADSCTRLLIRFRTTDGTGNLVHDFTDPAWSTRFLGDLYQDLSQYAKDSYALLQTPDFVEEFILDHTLTPAIETFGLNSATLIDPSCGSGHFLLGAFGRLFDAWRDAEPGVDGRELAQRSLGQVTGVDLNPFAAAIARFRLLVAALKASGIARLADAPDFSIDVAVGDSLLWGARPGQFAGMEAATATTDRQFLYRTEHANILRAIFGRQYTAVVGNPPYIRARDKALNIQYRERYPDACRGKYSLAAPFMQCFFELAITDGIHGRAAGFTGMITTNSFMKRESGKNLIERLIPTWDVTHVIDTSFSEIPGHNQTVILFGRHQRPTSTTIRTVMGIRGEASTPLDPSKGLVWSATTELLDTPNSENDYVTVADTIRTRFSTHPWSIGGGGAAELKERLDTSRGATLAALVQDIGVLAVLGEDEVLNRPRTRDWERIGVPGHLLRYLVFGESIRDWSAVSGPVVAYPYDNRGKPIDATRLDEIVWRWRTTLANYVFFGRLRADRGLRNVDYGALMADRLQTPLSIAFAEVATHNHFVFDRGGRVFNQTAPVIKLSERSTRDDHLSLLGVLNSSTACFWLKQACYKKASAHGGGSLDQPYSHMYAFNSSAVKELPIPKGDLPIGEPRSLDSLAAALALVEPNAVVADATPSRSRLDTARRDSTQILAAMVAAQEELDWRYLHIYGLTDEPLTVPGGETAPPVQLGERAFEIVLARQVATGDVNTAWFTKHRSTQITEMPSHWPDWYREIVQRRIDLIERDRDVALVERPENKRRWEREPWEKLERLALQAWLADRLEDRRLWFEGRGAGERAVCRTVAQLADRVGAIDPEFFDVARLWKGAIEIDPVALIGDVVAEEHVPAQSAARYKGKGLQKRAVWETSWVLQRIEDRGKPLPDGLERIPVPPKYASIDFAKGGYWKQRGSLDVPKERFTSIVGAEREADPTLVLAWAGFDNAQLAQAIATLAFERQQTDGWDPDRLWPIVVGLIELLPWLAQWHGEVDPGLGDSPANQYRAMAEQLALAGGRTIADAAKWAPTPPARRRKKKDQS